MKKVAVVFWSGTGNTEAMANAVAEGAVAAGAETSLFSPPEYGSFRPSDFDAIAFGCPAMGAEELEDGEFLPMFDSCKPELKGKKIALFGSYGWGIGEWMQSWEASCAALGAAFAADSVICHEAPEEDVLSDCRALGAALEK